MLTEISAALASVNGAVQLAKGVIGLQQDVAIKLELSKMLDAVLEAKTGLLTAAEKIDELKDEVRRLKGELGAVEDLTRYVFVELETGTQVVRVRPEAIHSDNEGKLTFCPNCFGRKEVRLLQAIRTSSYFNCFACNAVYKRDFREDNAVREQFARTDDSF